ncbi:hypothetical protein OUZ56_033430 [Daphnia magna]|uniref:Uncharacterized protein n=1 Tax=Daphnia magna TaxID=35525 RepID=A0ABR0BAQ5_9CRUS|nr:hypothetical protein OUZ56_033430 [Daphnia magna]
MRVSLYELEGKAKKTRKHLVVLRFPSAKGKTDGNIEGTLISPIEGELPGSLSWALYNNTTPRQITPKSASTTTDIYHLNPGGVIIERNTGQSPQLPPPSVSFTTPQTTSTPPNNSSRGTHTQRDSPLTIDLTPGGHEKQTLTQTLQPALGSPIGHEEPPIQAPLTFNNNTPNTHNASTDTLENLVILAEQSEDTESLSILDLLPPPELPVEALLEPKCIHIGKLLAEVKNVIAAKNVILTSYLIIVALQLSH